jgi:hypothetical protein
VWARRRQRAEQFDGDLSPALIEAVFREFLGRAASEDDVARWMQSASLGLFLEGVIASPEYRDRLERSRNRQQAAARGPYLNCWLPGWERFTRPVGEVSPDRVAIVGREGHLFLYGGTNNNLAAHRGEAALSADWLGAWERIVTGRLDHASRTGRRLAFVIVPDKLAVYDDLFPESLTPREQRPVLRLLEEVPQLLVYPERMLLEARSAGDSYLRTDSHLSVSGNAVLAAATVLQLGVTADPFGALLGSGPPYLAAGDLGEHFFPPVTEVMRPISVSSHAAIVEDNRAEIAAVGGHIGTRRVFLNEAAGDSRTVVVFGDSYGFGDDAYQGLTWFLAQWFRTVHFVWVPFGWDPHYLDSARADLVVCQTAERFVGRVPSESVNVASLARETIERRRALGQDRVFSDR